MTLIVSTEFNKAYNNKTQEISMKFINWVRFSFDYSYCYFQNQNLLEPRLQIM